MFLEAERLGWSDHVRCARAHVIVRYLPATAVAVAALTVAALAFKLHRLPSFPSPRPVLLAAAAVILGSGLVSLRYGRPPISPAGPADDVGVASWALALHVGIVLLLVPVLLLLKPMPTDDVPAWTWNFSYVNKPWLIGLYFLAVAGFFLRSGAIARRD